MADSNSAATTATAPAAPETPAPAETAPTLYAVLRVPESATDAEIKRAYVRLVRQFPPRDFPDEFQRVEEAYRILIDPRRRNEYRQTRISGAQVAALTAQADAAVAKGDAAKALLLLKGAIAMAPDVPAPREVMARALMSRKLYAEAEAEYRWLARELPRDETVHYRLARCLWLQKRYNDAEAALQEALRLNSHYHDAWMLMARVQESAGRPRHAAESLERAIANDGEENFSDLDALLRLCSANLAASDIDEVERTAQRIAAIIPTDDEMKARRAVRRLMERAKEMYRNGGNLSAACCVLKIAGGVPIEDAELSETVQRMARTMTIVEEASNLCHDSLVTTSIKSYVETLYLERLGAESGDDPQRAEWKRRQQRATALRQAEAEADMDPAWLMRAVEYVRREYPTLAEQQGVFLQEVADRAQVAENGGAQAMPTDGVMPSAPAAAESSGNGKRGFLGLGWLFSKGNSSNTSDSKQSAAR